MIERDATDEEIKIILAVTKRAYKDFYDAKEEIENICDTDKLKVYVSLIHTESMIKISLFELMHYLTPEAILEFIPHAIREAAEKYVNEE